MAPVGVPPTESERNRFEQLVMGRLRSVFDRNPWVVTTEITHGAADLAAAVQMLTDQPVLAIGACSGIGHYLDGSEVIDLGMEPSEEPAVNMRRGQALLADPPASSQAQVDRWNPDGTARAIVGSTDVAGLRMGRPTFGARPPSWRDLEDKLAIEALWDAAGIPVAPSRQVPLSDRAAVLGHGGGHHLGNVARGADRMRPESSANWT